jgi:hypothetical protein
MKLAYACVHIDRKHRALGLCNACYLKQNGGSKRWYGNNRSITIERASAWVRNNLGRRREIALRWVLRDNKLHPEKHALKERMRVTLKGNLKAARTVELLGCSMPKLRKHLSAQFREGMSWENYGKFGWHIDHVRPCSSFDLSDPLQQCICFHYTNLQPLWWFENLAKGATIV